MRYTGFVKRYSFIPPSKTAEFSYWLESMARRGLFLHDFLAFGKLNFSVSDEKEAKYAMRYIEPAAKDEFSASALEDGWKFVCGKEVKHKKKNYLLAVYISYSPEKPLSDGEEISDIFIASSDFFWTAVIAAVVFSVQIPVYVTAVYNINRFYRSFPDALYFAALLLSVVALIALRLIRRSDGKIRSYKRSLYFGRSFLAALVAIVLAILILDANISRNIEYTKIPNELTLSDYIGKIDGEATNEFCIEYAPTVFIRSGCEFEESNDTEGVWNKYIDYRYECIAESAYDNIEQSSSMYKEADWVLSADGTQKTSELSDGTKVTVILNKKTVYEIWRY